MLDHNSIRYEQEELKLLNQHFQTQVAAVHNNSTRGEGDPESEGSPNLHALMN